MLNVTALSGGGSGGPGAQTLYRPDAAIFDGTNDFLQLSANLTGAVNGQDYTWRVALKFNGGDGASQKIFGALINGPFSHDMTRLASNKIFFYSHDNPAVNFAFHTTSTTSITATTGWKHFMLSIDGSAGTIHYYLDDASDKGTTVIDDVNTGSVFSSLGIGALSGGTQKCNVSMCDFIYAQEYLDISVEATRRKFVNADGTIADWDTALGAFATTPRMALHLDDGEAAANFADNADGAGQAFTVNGTLTSENGQNG